MRFETSATVTAPSPLISPFNQFTVTFAVPPTTPLVERIVAVPMLEDGASIKSATVQAADRPTIETPSQTRLHRECVTELIQCGSGKLFGLAIGQGDNIRRNDNGREHLIDGHRHAAGNILSIGVGHRHAQRVSADLAECRDGRFSGVGAVGAERYRCRRRADGRPGVLQRALAEIRRAQRRKRRGRGRDGRRSGAAAVATVGGKVGIVEAE